MKKILRPFLMSILLLSINVVYANETGNSETTVPVKATYPMIEKHAPETIKKVCQRKSVIICPECEAAERILWCAAKLAITHNPAMDGVEILDYCAGYCGTTPNENIVIKIIDVIARKANLDHDEAFALLKEFNRSLFYLQRNAQHPSRDN